MGVFARIVIKLRLVVIVGAIALTAAAGSYLPRLEQDEDVLKFLPAEDPDIRLFRQVSADFGGLDVAIVGVESDRLLSAAGIEAVREMTRAPLAVDGVYHSVSFTEMPHLVVSEELFEIHPLVPDVVPRDRESLEEIRRNVINDDLIAGRLISGDGRAALIVFFLETDASMVDVARGIREIVTARAGHMHLYYGGMPFIQEHVGGGTRRDIINLTPWVLFVAALATFVFFRRFFGALLVMSAVALGAVWTIGGMAALGEPMTVVSTSLPIVLVAIGGAYGAHLLAAFYVSRGTTAKERVIVALQQVGPPVVASTLTTVAGFASFLAMDVAPMRSFGLQASVGVSLCALVALAFVPAVLSFGRAGASDKPPPAERLAEPLWRFSRLVNQRRWMTLGVVFAVAAVAGFWALRVAPDTSMENFFRPDSEPAQAERFLRQQFGGSMFLQISMRGDMSDPVVLDELRRIVEEAETIEGVARVDSFLQTLEKLAAGLGGLPRLPRTPGQVTSLQNFMTGNPALRQSVDDDLTRALVKVTLGTRDTRITDRVVEHMKRFIDDEIPRRVIAVDVRGDGQQVDAARARRLQMVAERIVRLLRGAGRTPRPDAERAVHAILVRHFGQWAIAPGDDLDRAVVEAVVGYFNSMDSPFESLDEAARPVGVALARQARQPVSPARLGELLPPLVPESVSSDREGMEMALPVLAERISEARAEVLARRLLPEVLDATGVDEVTDADRTLVRRALEELDDPRVGLPTDDPSEGLGIETGVTGSAVINRAFRRSTQRNFYRSLLVSLSALLLLGMIMFRSARIGVAALVPSVMTLAITLGLMGVLGTPLDPGTCMVAALSLGIGIDYSIHFLWRRRWRGLSLERTCRSVGPAIVFNAVEVASGFAVMTAASTVPLSRFGLLVMTAMLVAAVATFTILPAFERNIAEKTRA